MTKPNLPKKIKYDPNHVMVKKFTDKEYFEEATLRVPSAIHIFNLEEFIDNKYPEGTHSDGYDKVLREILDFLRSLQYREVKFISLWNEYAKLKLLSKKDVEDDQDKVS